MSAEDVTRAITGAQPPVPADLLRAEVERLAKLDRVGYLAERKSIAKQYSISAKSLDELVEEKRPKVAYVAESLAPAAPEQWPEPVEACALFDELYDFIARFVVVREHALTAIALWIAFTHCFEVAETSPRLAMLSPTKRCGKTRLLDLLDLLCLSAVSASNLSPSAIFRTIEAERCTLLIDEADTLGANKNDELRGILNSGHTRTSAYVIRNVPVGEGNWAPKRFSTFAPIALAAIGKLPDTWIDRSIVIGMKRKLRSQSVERLTRANQAAREQAAVLASKLARFAKDNLETLRNAKPKPAALDSDRAIDNWEHLHAIADVAGAGWPARARAAALALSGGGDEADDSLSVRLLADVKAIFDAEPKQPARDFVGSTELCDKLKAIELSPWGVGFGKRGKPLTPANLTRMLKQFEIFVTRAATTNGYKLADFEDAFRRYLTISPFGSSIIPQTEGRVGESQLSEVPPNGTSTSVETPTESTRSGTMELRNGGVDEDHRFSEAEEAEIDPLAAEDAADDEGVIE